MPPGSNNAGSPPARDTASLPDQVPSDLKQLGRYAIEKRIGAGGMGAVYLARDVQLKRQVALKVLPKEKAANPTLVRRFQAEAQAAAQLRHENIVTVYDSGEADGYLYIAMEFVDGVDIFDHVSKRGPMPLRRSIEVIKQVAAALQHAYEQGIVHRDIKPSNLLLRRDGVVKLTDLGLARSVDDTLETGITRAGTTVGTVDYMSPEQARSSKAADIRSDIYSLGCTWYQMLTCSPPFPEGSVTNKLHAHAVKSPPDPTDKNSNVTEAVVAVMHRMMAKKPEDRYQTPADLIADLGSHTLTRKGVANEILAELLDEQPARRKKGSRRSSSAATPPDELDDEDQEDAAPSAKKRSQKRSKSERTRPADRDEAGYDYDSVLNQLEPSDAEPADERPIGRSAAGSAGKSARDKGKDSERARQRKALRRHDTEEELEAEGPDDDSGDVAEESTSSRGPSAKRRGSHPTDSPVGRRASRTEPDEEDDRDDTDHQRSSNRAEAPAGVGRTRKMTAIPAADEDEEVDSRESSRPSAHRSGASATRTGSQRSLPPKQRPLSASGGQAEVPAGFKLDADLLKLGGALLAVLLVAGLAWNFLSGFGRTIDESTNVKPVPRSEQIEQLEPIKPAETAKDDGQSGHAVFDPSPPKTPDEIGMPAWVRDSRDTAGLKTVTVGPGVGVPGNFATLHEAIYDLPAEGGVVKLIGGGPFKLTRVVREMKQLIIEGAADARPVVILTSDPESPGSPPSLKVTRGIVEIKDVHFVLDRGKLAVSEPIRLISLVDSQFFFRNSSISVMGQSAAGVTAISLESIHEPEDLPPPSPPLALIYRTVIRGEAVEAVRVDRGLADVVIQDSLVVAGDAPAIHLSSVLKAGVASLERAKNPDQPLRSVRVFNSLLSSYQAVTQVEFSHESLPPPSTLLGFSQSVCASLAPEPTGVLLDAARWPETQPGAAISTTSGGPSEGRFAELLWRSQHSAFFGFRELIQLRPDAGFQVKTGANWQRVWRTNTDERQFSSRQWPPSGLNDISSLEPRDLDRDKLDFRDALPAEFVGLVQTPGVKAEWLVVPDFVNQQRRAAIHHRPTPPPIPEITPRDPEVKVNLNSEDLGARLKQNLPQGAVVIATGSGVRYSTPVHLDGKRVRIIFRQEDGANRQKLQILAKSPENASRPINEALFSVENGALHIDDADMAVASVDRSAPPWLISAKNSSVIIRNSVLRGPAGEKSKFEGLIRWQSPIGLEAAAPQLLITNSFLTGPKALVQADAGSGTVFARNSVFVVRGTAFDIRPQRTERQHLGSLDLMNVTISATQSGLRFQNAPGGTISEPFRAFVDRTVFAPPIGTDDQLQQSLPSMVALAGPVFEEQQLEWWGSNNGVAPEVRFVVRAEGDAQLSAEKTNAQAWQMLVGAQHDLRLLTQAGGVLLADRLPTRPQNILPESFKLAPGASASKWNDGKSIGADLSALRDIGPKQRPGSKSGSPRPNLNPDF